MNNRLNRTAELRAQVLEYEHALEHIAEEHEDNGHLAKIGRRDPYCQDCSRLAQSALARENKDDFLEIIKDGSVWRRLVRSLSRS